MLPLSDAASRIQGQEMFQILATARELERTGKNILHFELGDPDFSTPDNIVKAAFKSLNEGDTHYTPSSGLHDLKLMAQKVTLKSRGFIPDIDQLVVTTGANIQIYYAIACTVNPGDEVIVPDPGFVSYYSILNFLNVKSVPVTLREELGFTMKPEDIEKAITPRTKMIIINSPSNPTGGVVNKEQWQQIYNIAVKNNLYILSDEIYARMVYPDSEKFFSPSEFDKCKTNTIIVNGFSKVAALSIATKYPVSPDVNSAEYFGEILINLTSLGKPSISTVISVRFPVPVFLMYNSSVVVVSSFIKILSNEVSFSAVIKSFITNFVNTML